MSDKHWGLAAHDNDNEFPYSEIDLLVGYNV